MEVRQQNSSAPVDVASLSAGVPGVTETGTTDGTGSAGAGTSGNWNFGQEVRRDNSGQDLPVSDIVSQDASLYQSLGFTGPTHVTAGGGDSTAGVESLNPELTQFMADKGYRVAQRTGNADKGDPYLYNQAFDKAGNKVGKEISYIPDDGGAFGLVMGALTAMATGGLAAGALAGAGVTGAAAAAGTGAAAGFGGTLSQTADLGSAAKGAAIGAATGFAGGAAGAVGVTNPIGAGVINGAARGGVGAAITGGDIGDGVLMGGLKGAVPGVKKQIGYASGGVIPDVTGDPSGTADNLHIRVSGGEAILPADVVDALGPDFIHAMIATFHTPVGNRG